MQTAHGSTSLRVYLACTVRGDRAGLDAARAVRGWLEERGHDVLTTHLLADDVDRAESRLTERQVFERDLAWLDAADVLIAEASGSSYGVGFEVGYVLGRASASGQRVILLHRADRAALVSRLITGNCHARCRAYAYRDTTDLLGFIARELATPSGPSQVKT